MGKVAPLACLILGMQSKNLMALPERWLTVTHVAGISRIDFGWVRGSTDLKTLGKIPSIPSKCSVHGGHFLPSAPREGNHAVRCTPRRADAGLRYRIGTARLQLADSVWRQFPVLIVDNRGRMHKRCLPPAFVSVRKANGRNITTRGVSTHVFFGVVYTFSVN